MLRSATLRHPSDSSGEGYPFTIPALGRAGTIELDHPVVLLSGENGSGKSTFLEALAVHSRLPALGRQPAASDPTLSGPARLSRAMRLAWSPRLKRGFFMRAEDVFGYILRLQDQREEALTEIAALQRELTGASQHALSLALGPHRQTLADLDRRYGRHPDARSHGETFLHLFRERIAPAGLYLMDEPEAALSPQSQLALVALLSEAVEQGSQFIIATHSPLLLAIPGARILSFDEAPVRPVRWDELDSVQLWRDVLSAPERIMHRLWTRPEANGTRP